MRARCETCSVRGWLGGAPSVDLGARLVLNVRWRDWYLRLFLVVAGQERGAASCLCCGGSEALVGVREGRRDHSMSPGRGYEASILLHFGANGISAANNFRTRQIACAPSERLESVLPVAERAQRESRFQGWDCCVGFSAHLCNPAQASDRTCWDPPYLTRPPCVDVPVQQVVWIPGSCAVRHSVPVGSCGCPFYNTSPVITLAGIFAPRFAWIVRPSTSLLPLYTPPRLFTAYRCR